MHGRDIGALVARLPKVELHVHLEGSLRPATRARLAERHGLPGPEAAGIAFTDFDSFIASFMNGLDLLRGPDDLVLAIDDLAADLARNEVRYAEVTTTAWTHLVAKGVAPGAYAEALGEGRTIARRDHGVELGWVIDIPRGMERAGEQVTADLLCGPGCPDATVAIGLGGPEIGYPAEAYAESFARAAAVGLRRVPHGGETGGAGYVRDCIEVLQADRIGHGVMAVEDPTVLDLLVARRVPLEVSITSNVLLGVSPDVAHHQLSELRAAGVTVTLATDDPGLFDTDLCAELLLAHHHHGYDAADLLQLQFDGLDASFAGEAVRRQVRAELEAFAPEVDTGT